MRSLRTAMQPPRCGHQPCAILCDRDRRFRLLASAGSSPVSGNRRLICIWEEVDKPPRWGGRATTVRGAIRQLNHVPCAGANLRSRISCELDELAARARTALVPPHLPQDARGLHRPLYAEPEPLGDIPRRSPGDSIRHYPDALGDHRSTMCPCQPTRPRLGQSWRRQSPGRQSRFRQPGRGQRRHRRCDFCPGPGSGWPADGQCGVRVHRDRRPWRRRSYRIRYRRDGGGGWARGAQARLEEFAHPFDRLVQRQAALPAQILGGQRAVDPAGDGPRPGPQRDRRPIRITQRHRRGAGEMIASQPLAPADRFRPPGPPEGLRDSGDRWQPGWGYLP